MFDARTNPGLLAVAFFLLVAQRAVAICPLVDTAGHLFLRQHRFDEAMAIRLVLEERPAPGYSTPNLRAIAAAECREKVEADGDVWVSVGKFGVPGVPRAYADIKVGVAAAIGPITAAAYVATLGTPERFPDSSHVVSYLGLAVSTYDTGDRERHGHITKRGAADVRGLLCEAAQHASQPTHPLHPYFIRLYARYGRNVAIIAVAQRMARILFQLWRTGQDFAVRKLNVRPIQRVRSRTYYFEIKPPKALKA